MFEKGQIVIIKEIKYGDESRYKDLNICIGDTARVLMVGKNYKSFVLYNSQWKYKEWFGKKPVKFKNGDMGWWVSHKCLTRVKGFLPYKRL